MSRVPDELSKRANLIPHAIALTQESWDALRADSSTADFAREYLTKIGNGDMRVGAALVAELHPATFVRSLANLIVEELAINKSS